MSVTIATLQNHVRAIKRAASSVDNTDVVGPGQPLFLNAAAAIGDGVWQGDLGIEIVAGVPKGYKLTPAQHQLVPGDSIGARHRLTDLGTVTDFALPTGWSAEMTYEGLEGPYFRCAQDTTIAHPTHGPVTIAAGHCVGLRYQRNLDQETQRARRALD